MVELAELFGDVAASGQSEWAPSSNIPLGGNEQSRVNESEEGSGDSDEVIRGRTGLSGEFCSVTVGGSSGGNKHNAQGTSAGLKETKDQLLEFLKTECYGDD